MRYRNNLFRLFVSLVCLVAAGGMRAQNESQQEIIPMDSAVLQDTIFINEGDILVPSLFEYVVAPDDLPDLQSRTDYLMDHFWDPFDFKAHNAVDQNALNHAFEVYVQSMPYASEKKVKDSVKKLIGKIKNNPGLSFQFTRAAEETLYGPRAEFWVDEIYMNFLDNLLQNKKVSQSRKKKYQDQLELLKKNAIGSPLPAFSFISLDDKPSGFSVDTPFTIIEFRPVECDECRYADLKLDISSVVSDMLYDKTLTVYQCYLIGNENTVSGDELDLNTKWKVGYSKNAKDILDIRMLPSFFLIDGNGRILAKNRTVDGVINQLETDSKPNAK